MKKKICLSLMTIILLIISCTAFAGCSNTDPVKFLEKFAEAQKYTVTGYATDKANTQILSLRRSKRDYNYKVSASVYEFYALGLTSGYEIYELVDGKTKNYESDTIPSHMNERINTIKRDIIKEFVPNYEKGAIAKDALNNKFKKIDGKFFLLNGDGEVNEDYGCVVMKKGVLKIYNKDNILRYELKLSCSAIKKPKV